MNGKINLTSEDDINADALVEPIKAALEQAREQARMLGDEQLARATQSLELRNDDSADARVIRSVAIAAAEHIRADRIRQRLLEHYCAKEPTRFTEVDGQLYCDELSWGATVELMHCADVRVLIPERAQETPEELARLIRKIADWVSTAGNLDRARQMRADREGVLPSDFTNLPF